MGNIFDCLKNIPSSNIESNNFIRDNYNSFSELEQGLRKAGLEASQLIVGIDFTKSNEWQGGGGVFAHENLHHISDQPNPYQQVLSIMCKALAPFDKDQMIDAYGFGDSNTTDKSVFPMYTVNNGYGEKEFPCFKLEGVLERYNHLVGVTTLSGPTSFVPIIRKAIELVKERQEYHILLIIADGSVESMKENAKAIIEASNYPLSIICVGVGKGPWDDMETMDDNIPKRKFDNFQFVNFHQIMKQCENVDHQFAKHALMEIPEQYTYIKNHIF